VSTYTIGEVAGRSGFTASALRYYEGIGLLSPSARTDAGYRLYDDRVLARLAFIARAKRLGCSLEEVSDLVEMWDGERCGPVQRRFHDLVTDKIAASEGQVADLMAFAAQLAGAAAQLAGVAVDGPCGENCACVTEATGDAAPPAAPPIACSLDAGSRPDRLAEWRTVLAHTTSRAATADGGLRLELHDDVPLEEVARLAAAEQRCCPFFSFAITADQRGAALEVRAPDGATDVVASLFGAPA